MGPKVGLIGVLTGLILSACIGGTAPSPLSDVTTVIETTQQAVPATLLVTAAPSSPIRDSILTAGDYLVRQQLSNGQLAYQVNIESKARDYTPSYVHLIAGTGSLYTVCRVSANISYCEAGDKALAYYLDRLVEDPERFAGACLASENDCTLGSSALAVDAIYRRWRVTADFALGDRDLQEMALQLGRFIVWMRRPGGGFYHRFNPYYRGEVDPDYSDLHFSSESLLALMELYEMSDDPYWLQQADEVNTHMVNQPVTEDHWHSYALRMFARLGGLSAHDKTYAISIGEKVLAGESTSLDPSNSSIAAATKLEALAALGQALYQEQYPHVWLAPEMEKFAAFVMARQLPDNDCQWIISEEMNFDYAGGIFGSCDDPTIRVDGPQHWINGAAAYLEYLQLTGQQ